MSQKMDHMVSRNDDVRKGRLSDSNQNLYDFVYFSAPYSEVFMY